MPCRSALCADLTGLAHLRWDDDDDTEGAARLHSHKRMLSERNREKIAAERKARLARPSGRHLMLKSGLPSGVHRRQSSAGVAAGASTGALSSARRVSGVVRAPAEPSLFRSKSGPIRLPLARASVAAGPSGGEGRASSGLGRAAASARHSIARPSPVWLSAPRRVGGGAGAISALRRSTACSQRNEEDTEEDASYTPHRLFGSVQQKVAAAMASAPPLMRGDPSSGTTAAAAASIIDVFPALPRLHLHHAASFEKESGPVALPPGEPLSAVTPRSVLKPQSKLRQSSLSRTSSLKRTTTFDLPDEGGAASDGWSHEFRVAAGGGASAAHDDSPLRSPTSGRTAALIRKSSLCRRQPGVGTVAFATGSGGEPEDGGGGRDTVESAWPAVDPSFLCEQQPTEEGSGTASAPPSEALSPGSSWSGLSASADGGRRSSMQQPAAFGRVDSVMAAVDALGSAPSYGAAGGASRPRRSVSFHPEASHLATEDGGGEEGAEGERQESPPSARGGRQPPAGRGGAGAVLPPAQGGADSSVASPRGVEVLAPRSDSGHPRRAARVSLSSLVSDGGAAPPVSAAGRSGGFRVTATASGRSGRHSVAGPSQSGISGRGLSVAAQGTPSSRHRSSIASASHGSAARSGRHWNGDDLESQSVAGARKQLGIGGGGGGGIFGLAVPAWLGGTAPSRRFGIGAPAALIAARQTVTAADKAAAAEAQARFRSGKDSIVVPPARGVSGRHAVAAAGGSTHAPRRPPPPTKLDSNWAGDNIFNRPARFSVVLPSPSPAVSPRAHAARRATISLSRRSGRFSVGRSLSPEFSGRRSEESPAPARSGRFSVVASPSASNRSGRHKLAAHDLPRRSGRFPIATGAGVSGRSFVGPSHVNASFGGRGADASYGGGSGSSLRGRSGRFRVWVPANGASIGRKYVPAINEFYDRTLRHQRWLIVLRVVRPSARSCIVSPQRDGANHVGARA